MPHCGEVSRCATQQLFIQILYHGKLFVFLLAACGARPLTGGMACLGAG